MGNFIRNLAIDLDEEIRIREDELEEIGWDIPKKDTRDNEACYKRLNELSEIVAENLGIELEDNIENKLRSHVKIHDTYNPISFIRNPAKFDILLASMYLFSSLYNLVFTDDSPILLIPHTLAFLGIYHTIKCIPSMNFITNELTILRYGMFGWRDDYSFDDQASHELTHYLSLRNNPLKKLPSKKNLRREEGIAVASEALTLQKLYEQTGDINYRRTKLRGELRYLLRARIFKNPLNCFLTAFYPLNEITHRNHGEGYCKLLELYSIHGDLVLPRIFGGEFDDEFK